MSALSTSCFILSAMDGKIEQRVCIKICMKLGAMLREAFGENSLSRAAVFEWHSRFKPGRVSVEDDKRSGRPSTSKTTENVEKIRELVHEDRRRTIHELADTVGISYGVCQEILTENLNMCHIAVEVCSLRLLTNDQKQRRINVCASHISSRSTPHCSPTGTAGRPQAMIMPGTYQSHRH
jgi:transposase